MKALPKICTPTLNAQIVHNSHVRGQFSETFNIHHTQRVVVAVVVTVACVCTIIFVHPQITLRGHPAHAHNAAHGTAKHSAAEHGTAQHSTADVHCNIKRFKKQIRKVLRKRALNISSSEHFTYKSTNSVTLQLLCQCKLTGSI